MDKWEDLEIHIDPPLCLMPAHISCDATRQAYDGIIEHTSNAINSSTMASLWRDIHE